MATTKGESTGPNSQSASANTAAIAPQAAILFWVGVNCIREGEVETLKIKLKFYRACPKPNPPSVSSHFP